MPQKQEILNSLNKGTYSQAEVRFLIQSVTKEVDPNNIPAYIKKGDVFIHGFKNRPNVVFKVVGDMAYAIPLSSTEDCLNLTEANKCRFLNTVDKQYFGKGITVAKCSIVQQNFICTYDNPKELNRVIKLKKEEILSLF